MELLRSGGEAAVGPTGSLPVHQFQPAAVSTSPASSANSRTAAARAASAGRPEPRRRERRIVGIHRTPGEHHVARQEPALVERSTTSTWGPSGSSRTAITDAALRISSLTGGILAGWPGQRRRRHTPRHGPLRPPTRRRGDPRPRPHLVRRIYGPRALRRRRLLRAAARRPRGDFVTSPHIHPVFADSSPAASASCGSSSNGPILCALAEVGAGDGTLAAQLLEHLRDLPSSTRRWNAAREPGKPSRRSPASDRDGPARRSAHGARQRAAGQPAVPSRAHGPRAPRRSASGSRTANWSRCSPRQTTTYAQLPHELEDGDETVIPEGALGFVDTLAATLRHGYALLIDYGDEGGPGGARTAIGTIGWSRTRSTGPARGHHRGRGLRSRGLTGTRARAGGIPVRDPTSGPRRVGLRDLGARRTRTPASTPRRTRWPAGGARMERPESGDAPGGPRRPGPVPMAGPGLAGVVDTAMACRSGRCQTGTGSPRRTAQTRRLSSSTIDSSPSSPKGSISSASKVPGAGTRRPAFGHEDRPAVVRVPLTHEPGHVVPRHPHRVRTLHDSTPSSLDRNPRRPSRIANHVQPAEHHHADRPASDHRTGATATPPPARPAATHQRRVSRRQPRAHTSMRPPLGAPQPEPSERSIMIPLGLVVDWHRHARA